MFWFAFILCFFAWYGIAPLMKIVREEMLLTKEQIGWCIIGSVAITVIARLFIGWLCDHIGPRLAYTWLGKLEGGIDYLREVVIEDILGICDELESMMKSLVDTYHCEWKEVVDNPEKRRLFEQFVNTDAHQPSIELIPQRGQQRPVDWAPDFILTDNLKPPKTTHQDDNQKLYSGPREWIRVGTVSDFPAENGTTIKYGNSQIAVFNFTSRGEWYACQQMCPHKKAMVLSRGIIGDQQGIPKVACPQHKKTFSLENGACLGGEEQYSVNVFQVKVDEQENVYLELPEEKVLDELLSQVECAGAH